MLYRLVWGRFIACQMSNAVYDNVVVDAACEGHVFRANYSKLVFPGCTAVYDDEREEDAAAPKKPLPELNEGDSAEAREAQQGAEVHPAALPLYGGDAHPRDGGKGHRPARPPTRPR